MARAAEPTREVPNVEDDFEVQAREYIYLKKEMAELAAREKKIKAALMARLEAEGEEDAEGHLILDLDQGFEGVVGLVRQRRVSASQVDALVAEELLKERGLWERCAPPVPVIQEDEVYAALYEGLLSEEDVFQMYPEKITYALVMKK